MPKFAAVRRRAFLGSIAPQLQLSPGGGGGGGGGGGTPREGGRQARYPMEPGEQRESRRTAVLKAADCHDFTAPAALRLNDPPPQHCC